MIKLNLSKFRKEYDQYDIKREKIIKQSRVVLKLSKQLIYSIHRNNKSESLKLKEQLNKEYFKLLNIKDLSKKLEFEGSLNEASEEYVEAMLYFSYVYENNLVEFDELKVSIDNYLGGLSDLTGELGRRAVQMTIKKKYSEVYDIQEFVSSIFKEILKFNFRNGSLRKKSDAIKWNLTKIENIVYDIEIKEKN